MSNQNKEYMNKYIQENITKKKVSRIYIRERRPFEIFWTEILVVLAILFMLIMIFVNYQNNLNYLANQADKKNTSNQETREIDIGVDINEESRLDSSILDYLIDDKFFSETVFFT